MADGKLCVNCEEQETQHDLADLSIENQLTDCILNKSGFDDGELLTPKVDD